MTADDFYMDVYPDIVNISVKDGGVKTEAEIYIEDFVFALLKTNDNLDYIAEPVKDELIQRAVNECDLGTISEDELNIFKAVMAVIL